MSKQQEIIKNIMHALDTNEGGSSGLDKAIRQYTPFSGIQDAINHFVSARSKYNSADAFLKNACGIILDNVDTGAISGSDAGGNIVKSDASIVPESEALVNLGHNRYQFGNTNIYFYGSKFGDIYSVSTGNNTYRHERRLDYEQFGTGARGKAAAGMAYDLLYSILAPALRLVEESYGISLGEAGSGTNEIWIGFSNVGNDFDSYSTIAQTSLKYYYHNNADGTHIVNRYHPSKKISLVYNMDFFYSPSAGNNYNSYRRTYKDGRINKYSKYYLDRVTAHELTHAVMQANIENFGALPLWFVEGSAELVQGIDDVRGADIRRAAANESTLRYAIQEGSSRDAQGDEPLSAYYAGYMLLRYIAKQSAAFSSGELSKPSVDNGVIVNGTSIQLSDKWTSSTFWPGHAEAGAYTDPYTTIDASNMTGNRNIIGNGKNGTHIVGGKGHTEMWGGGACSDILEGGAGSNTYWFGAQDGNDTIMNYHVGKDAINLYNGGMSRLTTNGNDLQIDVGNSRLTVKGMGSKQVNFYLSGQRYGMEVARKVLRDTLIYNSDTQFYIGAANYQTILKVSEKNSIGVDLRARTNYSNIHCVDASGSTGVVTLVGADGCKLIGGKTCTNLWGASRAADTLMGGGDGLTAYWFGLGDGRDTIENSLNNDIIYLYHTDRYINASIQTNDLVLRLDGDDTITVKNWTNRGARVLQFADGSQSWLFADANGHVGTMPKRPAQA